MKTQHYFYFKDSRDMSLIASESVDLVVTSPPYPMIEMWDELFTRLNPDITKAWSGGGVIRIFEAMHQELDPVWQESYRVLKRGGLACINIGDATRTINNDFALFPNHARIISFMLSLGFLPLPAIIWRKQTNAPNKFMGSGMFPPGAYVTLEHEYILVFRKGSKMEFKTEADKENRRSSAIFWEERNNWFSDVWLDLKGTTQKMDHNQVRLRSAAYPFELPFRLINMFSVKGGLVLDPFLATGTTSLAAMAAGRSSIGFELEPQFKDLIIEQAETIVDPANEQIRIRLENHDRFIHDRLSSAYQFKYYNRHYGFPVMTSQEKDLILNELDTVLVKDDNSIEIDYHDQPGKGFQDLWPEGRVAGIKSSTGIGSVKKERQMSLLD